jgi:hypothetical protein
MSISLTSAIKICRLNTGDDVRLQSQRFLNPEYNICPQWNGKDMYGRSVHEDTRNLKSNAPGCFEAQDRVSVENDHRPRYSAYVTLNPQEGIHGVVNNSDEHKNHVSYQSTLRAETDLSHVQSYSGNPGYQQKSALYPSCSGSGYACLHKESGM